MRIGEKIRELRLEQGVKQCELAAIIHVAPNTLSQFENEKANPSYEVLTALADFFEVSVDYLLGRADDFGNITVKSTADNNITKEEKEILQSFRSLSRSEQTQLKEYATFLSKKKK